MHSINMPNVSQNKEIEHVNKEISLLQDRLKINEKSLNQFENRLMEIKRIRVKKGQSANLFESKKIYLKILNDIFKNKINYIKKSLIY